MQDPHQIRQDAIEEQVGSQDRGEDDDALAATAEELLQKVEHNQTEKFKNSQFLTLMRKLRDREVKVEGDKMVETSNVRSIYSPEAQQAQAQAPTSQPELLSAPSAVSTWAGFSMPRTPPEFDSHFELGWPGEMERNYDYDHWESPYK